MSHLKQLLPPAVIMFSQIFLLSACETPEERYDRETGQTEVLSRERIDEILAGFETIAFNDLDKSYKEYTDPGGKFTGDFKNRTYYIVEGDDIYQYIVGKFRIDQFLCTDQYYVTNRDHLDGGHQQYWLVDPEMLYMILDLILELDKRGYDKYGFYVRESHRHPAYNKERGGASLSQHIYGRAADLVIEDINRDGFATDEDKQIVLALLEEIVGNRGGLGLYPGTMTVHLDCRGYGARWDQR